MSPLRFKIFKNDAAFCRGGEPRSVLSKMTRFDPIAVLLRRDGFHVSVGVGCFRGEAASHALPITRKLNHLYS